MNVDAAIATAPCHGIKRFPPDINKIPQHVIKEIEKDYRTMPEFEKKMYEHVCVKHWSLNTNELLACRWKDFINNLASRKRTPMMFPSADDYHFYKGDTRYVPEQSMKFRKSFKMTLRPGPGVDNIGQIPTPYDMQLRMTQVSVRKLPGAAQRALNKEKKEHEKKKH